MNRKYITAAIVLLLFVFAFGFSRGWFSPSTASPDTESERISANQTMDQDNATDDVAQVSANATQPTTQAAD